VYFTAETLDDLLAPVLERLLRTRNRVDTSRGATREVTGVLLKIANPRARLSHTEMKGHVFSCLGELLWYLSKSNELDFISYYIPQYKKESTNGKTVYGGYGPRLFAERGHNQVENIIELLRRGPTTRRAVIQLFSAKDIKQRKVEVPCTCTLQFLLRKRKLDLFTNMRSNDAFKGLPHDVFAFTMLQELVARSLNVELGTYKHAVGSLHLYEADVERARKYLSEGWQTTEKPMPLMPFGDPWPAIKLLMSAEANIRSGAALPVEARRLRGYWADLVRLLQIFRFAKNKQFKEVTQIKRRMSTKVYHTYIQRKEREKPRAVSQQLTIPFPTGNEGATRVST
jgi:thymidylate synthase